MKNNKLVKRLAGAATAFAAALSCLVGAWAAGTDVPQLNFRNEKVAGLTITKEIFRTAEDTVPLRSGEDADRDFYSDNGLASDEFRMYLWGGSGGSMTPVKSSRYTRTNKYGDYYRCMKAYNDSDDIIIVPAAGDYGYKAYYYDGGVRTEFEPEKTGRYYEEAADSAVRSAYKKANIGERFVLDHYSGTPEYDTRRANLTKYFETDTQGTFYLSDGYDDDQVYFKQFPYAQYNVTEDTELLKTYNESKESGVYETKVAALTDENGNPKPYVSGDANEFQVKNYFDKPHDALKVYKSIPYFGTIANPINETFTFELLVKGKTPEGYSYKVYEGSTERSGGIFGKEADSATPAVFTLKGGERLEVYGIMKNKPVTVREILIRNGVDLNPAYTALRKETAADQLNGREYKYHEEKDEHNNVVKAYIEWENNFDVEIESKSVADFENVPNVMLITKQLDVPQEESYDFEFEIKRYDSDKGDYVSLAENEQVKYFLRDNNSGDFYGNPNSNGEAFISRNGLLTVKDGQTAMIVGLHEGEKFRIIETRALLDGTNVTAYFDMDSDPRYHTARPLKEEAGTYSLSLDTYSFTNSYDPPTGLFITKDVVDDYGRAKDEAYEFKLTLSNGNDLTVSANATIRIGTVEKPLADHWNADHKSINFELKDGESVQIKGLPYGNYIVTEVNPNQAKYCYDDKYQKLFTVSAQVDTFTPKIYYAAGDDSAAQQTDASSAPFDLTSDSTRSVTFTNTTKELKYYFDIEKIIYADRNAHGTSKGESEQRFLFRIERFDEDETNFSESKVREVFYADLSCDKVMYYDNNGVLKLSNDTYPYGEGLYTEPDDTSATHSSFANTSGDIKITKEYTSIEDGSTKRYIYAAVIYNGKVSVMVTKKGIYRITEVKEWSSTDYDFWYGSNQYKGFDGNGGDGTAYSDYNDGGEVSESGKPLKKSSNSVLISVTGTKAYMFDTPSSYIDVSNTPGDTTDDRLSYRPTASFTNSESEFAYLSSQSWAENYIGR